MKNNFLIVVSFLLTCSLNFNLLGQTDTIKKPDYYKVSEVRIYINDEADIRELRKQGLGIEHVKLQDNYFDALLDSFQLEVLKKSGYQYEIIIDDVTKDYLERTKDSREKIKLNKPSKGLGFGYGSMGGFYTFSEVVAQLDTMRLLYPNLITVKDSIGTSNDGRTIWAVKISDNPDINENEPEVFYNALTHGNEQQGMMTVIYYMYYLLENYGINPEVTYLVDNRELYFMPVINPDGYAYNEQISPNGGGMWRKNRRNNGSGIFGVNIQRNYGYMWGYDNIGSSPNPQNSEYRGTGPFSEPETQAVREFCQDHNFLISNVYHTYWNVIFPPWGYNLMQTQDSTIFNNLIACANSLNGYRNGIYIPQPENYPSNGDALDWMYGDINEKNRIFAILTEVGGADDGGFWPSPEKIIPLAEENLYTNIVCAWGPGVIENPPYIKNALLNIRYCRPLLDTVKIIAIETNPDNHTSNVFAKVLKLNDSLIIENQLNQIDSSFTGSLFLNSTEENFYKIILQQNGIDSPSKLFYNKLRFTTAGPVKLDSIRFLKGITNYYNLRPFVRNEGTSLTITNAKIQLRCSDPWVTAIAGAISIPSISPGLSVGASSWIAVTYVDSIFPGYFNLKAEMMVDGWAYWTDSIRINVITGIEEESTLPTAFRLEQNYPNPFNPHTKISWQLPVSSQVSLKVYDVLGNKVAKLVDEEMEAGYHSIDFNASDLPSSVYFYRIQAGNFIDTKKMILLK